MRSQWWLRCELVLTTMALCSLVATEAEADCADPYQCFCPWGVVAGVAGEVVDVQREELDSGAVLHSSTVRIDRAKSKPFATAPVRVGTEVELDFAARVGDRVFGAVTDDRQWEKFTIVVDGKLACFGPSITEDEALVLAGSADCRAAAEALIGTDSCSDGAGCSMGASGDKSPNGSMVAWLVVALFGLRRRRRHQAPCA